MDGSVSFGIKDVVMIVSSLGSILVVWGRLNQKVEHIGEDISRLDKLIHKDINKDRDLVIDKIEKIEDLINAGFKKVDENRDRINVLDKQMVTVVDKEEAIKNHPTRVELREKIEVLQKDDKDIKDQLKELKENIDKRLESLDGKIDNIERSLGEHAKEEEDMVRNILVGIEQLKRENGK